MLSPYFGRYAFGYADLRFATVQPLKSCQIKARFLNALGSRPLLSEKKAQGNSLRLVLVDNKGLEPLTLSTSRRRSTN